MTVTCAQLRRAVIIGALDSSLRQLYEADELTAQKERYAQLLSQLVQEGPDSPALLVRAPGRTELGGNHTDHNHGTVLAAAVDLDCVAAVSPLETGVIDLISAGYEERITVDLSNLAPRDEERGRPEALVRGVAAGFLAETGMTGGFKGYLHATFKPGTGLSSSAAFGVLIGGILNSFSAQNRLSAQQLALLAKEAENRYFGKPCGLMDQMTCAVGGALTIDFQSPQNPHIGQLVMSQSMGGYRLVVIDTGDSHANLTEEYAAIPEEMRKAASVLGQDVGRGLSRHQVLAGIPAIRKKAGDRAALRLLHFVEENERVMAMAEALISSNFPAFLQLVRQSGASSAMLLQNCVPQGAVSQQGILLGLALSSSFCPQAISRVHGGGFAGTIQAYVPKEMLADYCRNMERVFGAGSVLPIRIGKPGICCMDGRDVSFPADSGGA